MGRSPAEYEAFQTAKKTIRGVGRRMAWLGGLFVAGIVAMMVAHYVFQAPVYYGRNRARLATDAEILSCSALFGVGGLLIFVIGLTLGYGKKA